MSEVSLSESNSEVAIDNPEECLTIEEELEYELFFRTCIVARDKDILKIKMKKSIKMRETMIRQNAMEFHQMFPFYFIEPELVIALVLFLVSV